MADSIRIGLIGVGRMGGVHARHLATIPGAAVTAVADVSAEAARQTAREIGVDVVFEDAEPLLDRSDVDAVVICSATDTHAELIGRAAERGKHVFCEKPIALDLPSIDAALESVDSAGVALQVGFNRRFDPDFAAVRRAIERGDVGPPHLVRITSRDVEPPPLDYVKISGGLFLDMTIHDFDLARFLVGSEVRRVQAFGGSLVDPRIGAAGDVDTAAVLLEFEGGALCTIDNSRRSVYGYDQRVEVFGPEGAVRSGDGVSGIGVTRRPDPGPTRESQLERYLDSYRIEMESFVRALLEGSPPRVDGRDGRAAVVLGFAAQRSLREGRPVAPDEVESDAAPRVSG